MMNSRLQRTSTIIAEAVVVLLILVLANWLLSHAFLRLDLTASKRYTISKATKDLLAGLDDPVTVELFLSKTLAPDFQIYKNEVLDTLSEYQAYGKGKFKLKTTDPGEDEQQKERAQGLGVPELQTQIIKKGEMSVGKAYFGLAMSFEDKSEAIPSVKDVAPNLEYELTSRLVKLTQEERPKIGLFYGPLTFSEQQQPPKVDGIRQILSGADGLYDLVTLDPQADRVLPEGLKAVIVIGAWSMPDSLKYSIDQFLMNGGQVIVALDPMMQISQQQGGDPFQAYVSMETLEKQLEAYGVRFDRKLVVDGQCAQASWQTQFGMLAMAYPLWPDVGPGGLNKDFGAVANIDRLVFPWCCSLVDAKVAGVTVTPICQSTASAFLIKPPFSLDPQQDWEFLATTSEDKGPFTLACLVTGKLPTAFPTGPPEASTPPPAEGEEPPVTMEPQFDAAAQVKEAAEGARLVVFSTAAGLTDNFLGMPPYANAVLVANLVDMLAMGDQLIGIRSKPVESRPLKKLSQPQQSFWTWLNLVGTPLLVVLLGVVLWFLKGQRRRAIQAHYAALRGAGHGEVQDA